MAGRPRSARSGKDLSESDRIAWAAVTKTVTPLDPSKMWRGETPSPIGEGISPPRAKRLARDSSLTAPPSSTPPKNGIRSPVERLDDSWEKRIGRGSIMPERSIDLHGHSLAQAHARLNAALAQSVAEGVRVLLVVTGKPRDSGRGTDGRRGAIRAEIDHWIAAGPHADRIASVRGAHPRHGGAGALYLILRRKK